MSRRAKRPAQPEIDLPWRVEAGAVYRAATEAVQHLADGNDAVTSEAAFAAVAPLVALSEPRSRIRSLPWERVAAQLSRNELTPDDMKSPRWPNGSETLVT
jgi:hypothetical protein